MADVARIKGNISKMLAQGAPEQDVDAYLAGEGVTLADLQKAGKQLAEGVGPQMLDAAKSAGVGLGEGGIEFATAGGDVRNLAFGAQDWLAGKVSPEFQQTVRKIRPTAEKAVEWMLPQLSGPTSDQAKKFVADNVTGEFYEPQTVAGQYLHTGARFAPNMINPGTAGRNLVAGVVAPALASETAGQLTKGSQYEWLARLVGALTGNVAGSAGVSAVNSARNGMTGVSRGSSRVLEKTVTPGAEARLNELGPEALTMEATPATFGVAQGLVTRPGAAQATIVDTVKGRQAGANTRLMGDLDETLGPAVAPSGVERSLQQQRDSLHPLYQAVTGLNNPVEMRGIDTQLRAAIREESGATANALRRVRDMIAPAQGANGERIVRSTPREVLNVRQALDDELIKLADQPKAHATVTRFRALVDEALAEAVPDIKVLDATYSNLMRETEALGRGANVLKTGVEAIRPEDLIAERRALPLPQREAQRLGARAEIDRLVGTKANDITALKQLVQSEGDWNRAKLAEIFGAREAERIFNAVDREAAFQDTYRKLVENSQTAQRQGGARMIAAETGAGPNASMRDLTVLGAVAAAGQKGVRKISDAISGARRTEGDKELATALTKKGADRDLLVRAIRDAQKRRKDNATDPSQELLRALGSIRGARTDGRERK